MSARRAFTELSSLEKDSPNFAKQVAEQAQHYSAWRDVRSDGNCFYRAVACGLLEHYCRPFTPLSELENFYRRLFYQEAEPVREEDVSSYNVVLQVLYKLLDWKRAGSAALMQEVQKLLELDSFLTPFIKVLRFVAWSAIKAFALEPYFEGFEEMEEMQALLVNRHAAGDLDHIGIAGGLDVVVVLVEMGKANIEVLTKHFERGTRVHVSGPKNAMPSDPKGRLRLHIGLNAGHFMVFYRKGLEALEEEQDKLYAPLVAADLQHCERYARLVRT